MFENFQPYSEPENCGVILPKIKVSKEELSLIDSSLTEDSSSYDILKALAKKGLREKGIISWPNRQQYYDRAKQELETFDELGFVDYVLLNWDILKFCRDSNIVAGGGRGSSPSSLVLFLLGVTDIDPIEHVLFFERFVSKTRAKKIYDKSGKEFLVGSLLPDVDTDISYDKRHLVVSYIEEKHRGKTAKILTFNTFSSKLCIREAAKYFCEIGEAEASEISDLIPKNHGIVADLEDAYNDVPKFKEWADRNPLAYKNALKIQDLNKNTGQHPSGISICAEPIEDVMPLQRTKEGEIISGYDMNGVADLMVKFDILGLRTLTVAHNTCEKLGLKLSDIDPHDPLIYEVMQDFRLPTGLFQISSPTNFRAAQQIKPINLDEMADVIAVARPSSIAFLDDYVETKKNPQPLGLHPELDAILAKTKNVMLFQETLILASNKVFGFSLEDGELLRRCLAKKKVDEVGEWKEKIYTAALERGIETKVADYFWGVVEASANYGFNRCLEKSTIVQTENGVKEISRLKAGEKVLSFDTKSQTNVFVEVEDVIVSENDLFEYEFEDGRKIICSKTHKFLTSQGMKTIDEIVKNDLDVFVDDKLEYFLQVEMNENYLVSNKGRIYSKYRLANKRWQGGKIINPPPDTKGYVKASYCKEGQERQRESVHRAVAKAFLPNPHGYLEVNHKNGIKTDNSVENLEWCDRAHNARHVYSSGLQDRYEATKHLKKYFGEASGCSKLKTEQVLEIRRLAAEGETGKSIAQKFNIAHSNACRIIKREAWKHV